MLLLQNNNIQHNILISAKKHQTTTPVVTGWKINETNVYSEIHKGRLVYHKK